MYSPADGRFEFHPGAIFAQVIIADEINRSSPKTQSALLEAMEERQVTEDGTTHALPSPFFVVATLNPMEMEGTYALPEAQLDRFMIRLSMGYPDAAAEAHMIRQRDTGDPLETLSPVISARGVHALIGWARSVRIAPVVADFAVSLAAATRDDDALALGASPRATLQLVRAAKVHAALEGREFVIPDDLLDLAPPVFAHRLIANQLNLAHDRGRTGVSEDTVARIISRVPVPVARPRL